jgi:hypothetical protein
MLGAFMSNPDTPVETPVVPVDAAVTNTPSAEVVTPPTETPEVKDAPAEIVYSDFKVPDGMEVDTELLESYAPLFKKAGLTQEEAQAHVDAYAKKVGGYAAKGEEIFTKMYDEKRTSDQAAQSETWAKELRADPELGGANFDVVRGRVLEALAAKGSPELTKTFNELGLGNNPHIVRFINAMAQGYQPQDRGETPSGAGGTGSKSLEERLYGKPKT